MTDTLIILNYNIDGLNNINLQYRTDIVLSIIFSENPDVIHLQEVVREIYDKICSTMRHNDYHSCNYGNIEMPYFTLTFIKKIYAESNTFKVERKPYANVDSRSFQGRDMIQVKFHYHGLDWLLINSHLESQGTVFKSQGSTARQGQLTEIFTTMQNHSGPAISSGDFNIRDQEALKVLEKFPNHYLKDACLELNTKKISSKHNTWFLPGIPSRFSARYDRIYSSSSSSSSTQYDRNIIVPIEFKILGGDSIYDGDEWKTMDPQPSYLTASDHRAIVAIYRFYNNNNNKSSSNNTDQSISNIKNSNLVPTINSFDLTNDDAMHHEITKKRKLSNMTTSTSESTVQFSINQPDDDYVVTSKSKQHNSIATSDNVVIIDD